MFYNIIKPVTQESENTEFGYFSAIQYFKKKPHTYSFSETEWGYILSNIYFPVQKVLHLFYLFMFSYLWTQSVKETTSIWFFHLVY